MELSKVNSIEEKISCIDGLAQLMLQIDKNADIDANMLSNIALNILTISKEIHSILNE